MEVPFCPTFSEQDLRFLRVFCLKGSLRKVQCSEREGHCLLLFGCHWAYMKYLVCTTHIPGFILTPITCNNYYRTSHSRLPHRFLNFSQSKHQSPLNAARGSTFLCPFFIFSLLTFSYPCISTSLLVSYPSSTLPALPLLSILSPTQPQPHPTNLLIVPAPPTWRSSPAPGDWLCPHTPFSGPAQTWKTSWKSWGGRKLIECLLSCRAGCPT